jgi:hypothetical protein
MLEQAYLYKGELNNLYTRFITSDRSINYYNSYSNFELTVVDNDWSKIQLVSVCNGEVVGLFQCDVYRYNNTIDNVAICRFLLDNVYTEEFIKDMNRFICYLINHGFNKMSWRVYSSNTRVLKLDRLFIKQFGIHGIELGVKRDHVTLRNGEFVDCHLFEVHFRKPKSNKLYTEAEIFLNKHNSI